MNWSPVNKAFATRAENVRRKQERRKAVKFARAERAALRAVEGVDI